MSIADTARFAKPRRTGHSLSKNTKEEKMQRVNFVCKQEQCKIGHIEISDGQQVVLTPRELATAFVPERPVFKVVGHHKIGEVFRCPHCQGQVIVDGDENRRPLILGNAVVSFEPVSKAV